MDPFQWIERELAPTPCTSDAFIYDDMESQSGRSLPIIYQPFDPARKMHWRERGAAFDFLYAAAAEGARVLDFGPGDGWPSLIVAPYVGEVVGVDGSQRRVAVCTENAARLGMANARFAYVRPGAPLPFADGSFDAAMAASSIEQTPDPRATLAEIYRVLRPGGRLRMYYEALSRYRGGEERDTWLWAPDDARCRLILIDRDVAGERAVQYGLTFALPAAAVRQAFGVREGSIPFAAVTVERLAALRPALVDARVCTTIHPSGATLARWLRETGFREVRPTHSGIAFAGALHEQLPAEARQWSQEAVDAYLRPIVKAVVELLAPVETDPMITAVK